MIKTGETKGNVHEKFTTMGNQSVEYVRGGERNYSLVVEGNCIVDEKCNGTATIIKETKGNVEEKTTRNSNLDYSTLVKGNEVVNQRCNGNLIKRGVTKGNVHEKFITMGNQKEEYFRGGDVNIKYFLEKN